MQDNASSLHNGIDDLQPLTVESIRQLWSMTYNSEGKPDWSHIFPYYHPDIHFQDSIQSIEGIEEFTAMCDRLTDRCEQLTMTLFNIVASGNTFFFDWEMRMIFKRSPSTPIYGATQLTIGDDHRIISQRDYYDLWGDIFNGIPRFRPLYRRFMRRYFG